MAAPGPRPTRPARGRAIRRLRWRHPLRVMLLLALAPVVLVLALPVLLLGQEITAPSWVRDRIEAEAERALDGGSLAFGAVTVTVGRDLHPRVRLLEAEMRDASGRLLAHVPELDATLSPRGLLAGRLLVQAIAVRGAEASLTRAEDGRVDLVAVAGGRLAGGRPPPQEAAPPPSGRPAPGLASIPDRLERVFDRPALEALRRVELSGLVVNYDDARAGRAWTLDGGSLSLDLTGGETRLTGELSLLSGRGYVTTARLDYRSPRGSPEASIGVTLTDVAADDIATQTTALAWLGVVDSPISLALRASIDADGRLGPLHVALKIAEGDIRPEGGVPPVAFDVARAYLSYDPATRSMSLERLELQSDWGRLRAGGRMWVEGEGESGGEGRPPAFVGQLRIDEAVLSPPRWLDRPLRLTDASADLRLSLRPFALDVIQAGAVDEGSGEPGAAPGLGRVSATARVGASPEGWSVALDLAGARAGLDRLMEIWPRAWRPGLRGWFEANLTAGTFEGPTVALRTAPGEPTRLAVSTRFEGGVVRPLLTHPPITGARGRLWWDTGALSVALEAGRVEAPEGGSLDVGGSALTMPAGGGDRPPARVDLVAEGPIVAGLSLLDLPPLSLLSSAGYPAALAEGQARATGTVDVRIGSMTPDELRYDIAGTLSDVASDVLVPGWTLAADALAVAATEEGIAISGPARLDGIAAEGSWTQAHDGSGRSRVEADVAVTPAALAEIGVVLPDGAVTGEGRGRVVLDLGPGEAPRFDFRSDLAGLRLRLPEVGWSKGPGAGAAFTVEGRLGSPPSIDRIAIDAPGLSAEGDVTLTPAGALDRLDLASVELGGWFDGPVRLRGRGSATPAIEVRGGTLDLRTSTLGEGSGSGGGGGSSGEGGPITVRLDRLQVTDGIALTGLVADLSTEAGVEGTFRGQVNGGPEVSGRVTPVGDRVGARIQGADAGAVLRAADIFSMTEGGTLDLLLLPVGDASYDGEAYITGLRVRDAPVLASMLNAVSVVGLLQQLGGQGIVFETVAADFRIDPTRVIVERSSAVGVGLGLSLDGTYDTASETVDFRGVFSPLYLINGIGQIFSRPGEGLIGFNYTLRGPAADPAIGVNPLSALTPGMFRDIFRAEPPVPGG